MRPRPEALTARAAGGARRAGGVLLLAGLAACGDGAPPDFAVADSAGVRVAVTADGPLVYGEVDPEPLLSLGGPDASGPAQFSGIRGIHVDAEDRLWVVDGTSAEVRIFDADGGHRKTVGGQGEGPGEFRRPRLLGAFRGDSVAVWDDDSKRLTILDGAANLGKTTTARPGDDPAPHPYAIFPDGRLLALSPRIYPASALTPGTVLRDSAGLVRYDVASMTSTPVVDREGPRWVWTGRDQVPIPFTINPGLDLDGDALHMASGPEHRLRVFEDGKLTEVYGVSRPPREVSREAIDEYEDYLSRALSDSARRVAYLSALDHPERTKLLPGYARLVVAPDGAVWTQVYAPDPLAPATWDVYGPDRRWLGGVTMPERFWLAAVRDDRLAGVWLDEWDVEHVRVYRLVRSRAR